MNFILLVVFGFLSFGSQASFEDLIYGGTGCPADSANVTVDAFGATLAFSQFTADLTSGRRKTCNLAISIDVPAGYQISHGPITIRGMHELGAQSIVRISGETFFAGTIGQAFAFATIGPSLDEFTHVIMPQREWSLCGRSVILRLNTTMFVKRSSGDAADSSSANIDYMRIERPIFRRCS